MTLNTDDARPVIALTMGDPAGISPELTAKLIAMEDVRDAAHLVVIGDRRILDEGAQSAGLTLDLASATLETFESAGTQQHVFIDLAHLDPADVDRGEATLAGGTFATTNFRTALQLADTGPRAGGLLHAVQQEGNAFCLSGL